MKLTKFEDTLHQRLSDPDYAQAYLQAALSDGGKSEWLVALKEVAAASEGGFSKVAEKASLGRESMYKALSSDGNPRWSTVVSVLHAVGFELKVEKREPSSVYKFEQLKSTNSSRSYQQVRGHGAPCNADSVAAKPLPPGARGSSSGVYNLVGPRGGKSSAGSALSGRSGDRTKGDVAKSVIKRKK